MSVFGIGSLEQDMMCPLNATRMFQFKSMLSPIRERKIGLIGDNEGMTQGKMNAESSGEEVIQLQKCAGVRDTRHDILHIV